ncbi:MAG TPA: dolichyl-phosphate beta-glucosyltransferase [Pyrinomonadaceae bacterium]|nr:dolichyl-phosphate beta-glucosyltransferase [Pyrinomonadaceae bacterium]
MMKNLFPISVSVELDAAIATLVVATAEILAQCSPISPDPSGISRYDILPSSLLNSINLMQATVSIVVPAYNEGTRLRESLPRILAYLNQEFPGSELIVVDDGSTDDTAAVAREALASAAGVRTGVLSYKQNLGKGRAVRLGLLASRCDVALFTDADLSTPITETPKLVTPIFSGECDLTFGSRALDRKLIGVHQPWRREQGGRVFNLAVRLATGLPFWDTQCGFKAFRMQVCRPLIEGATIDRFGFDVELIYLAYRAGLRLREIPVRWDHYEGSKVNVFSDSFKMLNEVGLIRQQARRGVYDQAIKAARDLSGN